MRSLAVRSIPNSALVLAIAAVVAGCTGGASSPATPFTQPTPGAASASPSPVPSASPLAPQLSGQIVFADGQAASGNWQIYIENGDGTNLRQLVRSDADDYTPSLSPDGTQVVFHRVDKSGTKDQILVVNVDGTNVHEIKPDGCPGICGDAVEGARAWSADGHILFIRAIFKPPVDGPVNVGVWVMNVDGSGARQLTNVGGNCPNACADGFQDDEASWSPDGKHIVFMRDRYTTPERHSLFTMAADGTELNFLGHLGMDSGDPDWSPDGSTIVFQSPAEPGEAGLQNLWTIHPDGTGLTPLPAQLSSGFTFHPCWSPDGSHIVFSHSPGVGSDRADLFVINADGSDLHVLASTQLNENAACWGPSPPG
jgi:Tol biopolymer transport system component